MLSDTQIRSLKLEDGKRHADRDGLVLELRPSKKKLNKVFIFRFQWDKKPQTITIGNYQSISLAEARDIALSYRNLVNKGVDPRTIVLYIGLIYPYGKSYCLSIKIKSPP